MPPQVSAILLAAGSSRRMGRPKQLLPLNGKPALKLCLECIIASGVADIVVVLGRNGNDMARALGGAPAKIAYNNSLESEMAESVRTGLRETSASASGVLVCLSDHPLVSPDTLRNLVLTHSKEPGAILIPLYKGRKGHPPLFPAALVREVFSGLNLRDLIARHSSRVHAVDVPDEGIVLDMDTPDDYERIRRRLERSPQP